MYKAIYIMTETRMTKIEEGLQTFDFVSRCGHQLHLHLLCLGGFGETVYCRLAMHLMKLLVACIT